MFKLSLIKYPGTGGGGGGGITSITTHSTPTLNLSASGSTVVSIFGNVNISSATGNTIVANADGLYGLPMTVLANNGLSIDPSSTSTSPIVALGDGVDGSTAKFLSNRFINANTFSLNILGIGDPSNNAPGIIFTEASGRVFGSAPFLLFNNSTGGEIGRVNFGDNGGIFIGKYAGVGDLRSEDIFIGGQNPTSYNTGGSNISIGFTALGQSPNVGTQNVAIGNQAMAGLSSGGNYNVAVGQNAGFSINGNNNTSIGSYSGEGLATGTANTIVGSATAFGGGGSTGNANTFVGAFTQTYITSTFGSGSTLVGSYNGEYTPVGSNFITLGCYNSYNITRPSNSTIIGNYIDCSLNNVFLLGTTSQNIIFRSNLLGQTDNGSSLQFTGSQSHSLLVNANLTLALDATMSNVVLTGATAVTLPLASNAINRVYSIASYVSGSTISQYTDIDGTLKTSVPAKGSLRLQSDGLVWRNLVGNSGSSSTPALSINTVSANYPLTITDNIILVDASSGNVVITAPAPSLVTGIVFTVKKIDSTSNTVTIVPASGTIEFRASVVMNVIGTSIDFVSDSSNYYIK